MICKRVNLEQETRDIAVSTRGITFRLFLTLLLVQKQNSIVSRTHVREMRKFLVQYTVSCLAGDILSLTDSISPNVRSDNFSNISEWEFLFFPLFLFFPSFFLRSRPWVASVTPCHLLRNLRDTKLVAGNRACHSPLPKVNRVAVLITQIPISQLYPTRSSFVFWILCTDVRSIIENFIAMETFVIGSLEQERSMSKQLAESWKLNASARDSCRGTIVLRHV